MVISVSGELSASILKMSERGRSMLVWNCTRPCAVMHKDTVSVTFGFTYGIKVFAWDGVVWYSNFGVM